MTNLFYSTMRRGASMLGARATSIVCATLGVALVVSPQVLAQMPDDQGRAAENPPPCAVSAERSDRGVSGVVTDAQGAGIAGALVVSACGTRKWETQTAADGTFAIQLAPGTYLVRVTMSGFRHATERVRVSVERDAQITVTLTVAPVAEAVTVTVVTGPALRSSSGTKTDTPLLETPQSISVVTRQLMDVRNATSVNEAVSYTAGIKAEAWGADPRYDWTSLRGFDSYSPGFYRDGLPARNNNTWFTWRMEPYGLERVEVLRGPASVLYGQSNPGGIVNVVSKRPPEQRFGQVQLSVGSFGRVQGAVDVGGRVNDDGTLLYRLTALARSSDYQVDFVEDDRLFVAPAVTWKPSRQTTLTVLGHYQDDETGSGINFFPREGTLLPNPNGRIPVHRFSGETSYDGYDQSAWAAGALLEHRAGSIWTLRQSTRYGTLDLDYRQVYGAGLDPDDPSQRILLRNAFFSQEAVHALTIDNQAQAAFRTGAVRHRLLVGLDYQRHRFDQRSGDGGGPPIDVYNPVYGQPIDEPPLFADADSVLSQTGVYLQDQMKLDPRWVFTLAARHDSTSTATDDQLERVRREQDDAKLTSRAGVVYLSDIGLAPYASYAESFMPVTGTDTRTGRPFEPETGRQYEVGVKFQPAGGRSSVSLGLFDLRRRNYLTTEPSTFLSRQTGEIQSRGLELESSLTIANGLMITGAYTWLRDFEILESSDPGELGKREPIVPEHMASVWGQYRFPQGRLKGFTIGAGLRYTGETFGDIANSAGLTVPDYALLDASLSYEIGPWQVGVAGRNLADKVTMACWDNCFYGARRSVNMTLGHRW